MPESGSVSSNGTVLQGRYRLVSRIAQGGMGEVWEAVDDILTRPVAVKLLHHHLAADDDLRERFRREAIAAARLSHPNIVGTYDTGEDDGTTFIVMELVRGRTVQSLLGEGHIPVARACAIAAQVADALEHAHAAGTVHRDIKPSNILVPDEPEPRTVKVADFGIARAVTSDATLTQPGVLLGTAAYLSPEQVRGEPGDARSDVYALGVVLYEMLTGRPPFAGEDRFSVALARLDREPLRPRQVRAGIPRAVEAIVLRAMAREPSKRFPSAAAMAAALRAVDIGDDDAEPVVTRDPTPPEGVPLSFRHAERRWLVPAALIVLVAIALTVLGYSFSRSEVGREILSRPRGEAAPAAPLAIAAVHSFDPPPGDGEENDRDISAVIDGDPGTRWRTDTYDSRPFGRLKRGVGIWLELEAISSLRRLVVSSPTRGWSAQVHVADDPAGALAGWGEPVATLSEVDGNATIELRGARGRAVLLWFTLLGEDRRVTVNEVTLSADG